MTPPRARVRPSKYGAVKTEVDGIVFHSAKEARRYSELKLLEKAGEIRYLKLQPYFTLMAPVVINGRENINEGRISGMRPLGEYRADFSYEAFEDDGRWHFVVEDVKGFKTPMYRWKKRHVESQHDIRVVEI